MKPKMKLFDLMMFGKPVKDEERKMSVDQIMIDAEKNDEPCIVLAAYGVRALFMIANELRAIRDYM